MRHRHLRMVIVFGSIILAGLMIVQIYWFKKAFDVAEKQFDHSVQVALKEVADSVVFDGARDTEVKKLSSSFFFVATNSDIDFEMVDSLVKNQFLLRQLEVDYELGIYNAYDDTLVYGNYIHATKMRLTEREFSGETAPEQEKNFAIYFPAKKSYLAAELNIWIFSTIVLLLMMGFFAYAIFSLLREKRFSELKNDFINNMAHELRTPVTNIKIAGEVLKKKSADSSVYLDILEKENEKLRQKIDQVLLAAMGNNLKNRHFEAVDIHEIITQCAETFKLKIEKRNGNISLDFNAGNAAIAGDKELLTQAINNIIDNAEKYSPARPMIQVQTMEDLKGIVVKIKDKGIGIPHDMERKVFDKFFRVNTGNIHDVKGFGLGLNFVKNVIRAHKGKISLASQPDTGTEVSIYFPKVI